MCNTPGHIGLYFPRKPQVYTLTLVQGSARCIWAYRHDTVGRAAICFRLGWRNPPQNVAALSSRRLHIGIYMFCICIYIALLSKLRKNQRLILGSSNYTAHWPRQPASWVARSVGRSMGWLVVRVQAQPVVVAHQLPSHPLNLMWRQLTSIVDFLLLFSLSCRYVYFFSICCLHCIDIDFGSRLTLCVHIVFRIYLAVGNCLFLARIHAHKHTVASSLSSAKHLSALFRCISFIYYFCVCVCVH